MSVRLVNDRERLAIIRRLAEPAPGVLKAVNAAADLHRRLQELGGGNGDAISRAYADRLRTGADGVTAESLESFVREFAVAYATYDAAHRLVAHGALSAADTRVARELDNTIPALYKARLKDLAGAVAALGEAAGALPRGQAALDADAVLQAGAGEAYLAVDTAVSFLAEWSSVFPPAKAGQLGDGGLWVLRLVDVPQTQPRFTHRVYEMDLNDPQETDRRDAVQRLAKDTGVSLSLTLVDVVRGEYPGCTLAPCESVKELTERQARANPAFLQRRATEQEVERYNQRVEPLRERPPIIVTR